MAIVKKTICAVAFAATGVNASYRSYSKSYVSESSDAPSYGARKTSSTSRSYGSRRGDGEGDDDSDGDHADVADIVNSALQGAGDVGQAIGGAVQNVVQGLMGSMTAGKPFEKGSQRPKISEPLKADEEPTDDDLYENLVDKIMKELEEKKIDQ